MSEKRFDLVFTGVDGGPCPSCGETGLLLSDRGVYGQERTLTHTAADGLRECTVQMSAGSVSVDPMDGVWTFEPRETAAADSIPLSDQAVYHLSPGCRCSWASVGGTVGITDQHPECKIDHETAEIAHEA